MDNWQEQLNKKSKELNLEGGESNVSSSVSSGSSGGCSSSSGSAISPEIRKDLNKVNDNVIIDKDNKQFKKEVRNTMITVEGALKDLEAIEKEANDTGARTVVKALKVVVKFLSTMRSNQLLTEVEKVNIRQAREVRKTQEKK
jgi:hypothetical protein